MKINSIYLFDYETFGTSQHGQSEVEIEGLGKFKVADYLTDKTIKAMKADVTEHVTKLLEAAK